MRNQPRTYTELQVHRTKCPLITDSFLQTHSDLNAVRSALSSICMYIIIRDFRLAAFEHSFVESALRNRLDPLFPQVFAWWRARVFDDNCLRSLYGYRNIRPLLAIDQSRYEHIPKLLSALVLHRVKSSLTVCSKDGFYVCTNLCSKTASRKSLMTGSKNGKKKKKIHQSSSFHSGQPSIGTKLTKSSHRGSC